MPIKELKQNPKEKKTHIETDSFWKKGIIIAIIALLVIIIIIFYIYTVNVPQGAQDMGVGAYTQEELDRMFPQIQNADVPTRTTPEQTYANLKKALKNEDVEAAAECFAEEVREEYRKAFLDAQKKGIIKGIEEDLANELKQDYIYEARAHYTFIKNIDGRNINYPITFTKDSNGDWKIKSL